MMDNRVFNLQEVSAKRTNTNIVTMVNWRPVDERSFQAAFANISNVQESQRKSEK